MTPTYCLTTVSTRSSGAARGPGSTWWWPPTWIRVLRTHSAWIRALRDSRIGLALGAAGDPGLWGARRAPRASDTWPPGRGVLLVDGAAELIQIAEP